MTHVFGFVGFCGWMGPLGFASSPCLQQKTPPQRQASEAQPLPSEPQTGTEAAPLSVEGEEERNNVPAQPVCSTPSPFERRFAGPCDMAFSGFFL